MKTLHSSKIKAIREELGISQNILAELSGVYQANLSLIERGLVSPNEATLDKINKVFEVYREKRKNIAENHFFKPKSKEILINEIHLRIPATTANVGPGYDIFALALIILKIMSN